MSVFTKNKLIEHFFDVKSEKEYIEIESSGLIDIESTFPYFKALVSYYMSLNSDKPTASQAKQALSSMSNGQVKNTGSCTLQIEKFISGATFGALAIASPIVGSVFATAALAISKQVGAFSLFSKSHTSSLFAKGIDFIK